MPTAGLSHPLGASPSRHGNRPDPAPHPEPLTSAAPSNDRSASDRGGPERRLVLWIYRFLLATARFSYGLAGTVRFCPPYGRRRSVPGTAPDAVDSCSRAAAVIVRAEGQRKGRRRAESAVHRLTGRDHRGPLLRGPRPRTGTGRTRTGHPCRAAPDGAAALARFDLRLAADRRGSGRLAGRPTW